MMENKKMRAEHPKKELAVDILYDIIGSILFGAGIYTFAEGGNFAPGGISGIALIMNKLWNLPVGTMTLILNIPLVIISYKTVGKRFLMKTARTMIISTIFVDLVFPMFPYYTGQRLLAAIYSGALLGLGMVLFYMRGSSSGGADFLTMTIKKKRPHMSLGRLTLLIDLIIILIGWPVFGDVDSVLYGLIAVFVCSMVIDKILYGIGAGTLAIIVTSKGEETAEEIEEELQQFEETFDELRIGTLLTGPYDRDNAIVTLHAGAGGTESCDWTGMLYRMYTRWAEKKGYSIEELDYLEGDVAGVKGVTFEVKGENAYGYLRSEKGVHRLVRISPFNSAGKRQTSFASCDVIPDIEEDIDIEINDDDLKIDTYRSSGAGGQHINKTSSAVRITHLPTGIVVQCQNERSQHMNKDKAMQMLKSKLYLMKQQEQAEKMSDIRGEVRDINFGNQIRSYVMQPYTMVKDHRTNAEVSNVGGVMDGNIDPFINAYLSANTEQASEQ